MFQLSSDPTFHFEILRSLALTRYYGSDVSETLAILPNIKPGDFEDWYREWHNLSIRVLSTIDKSKIDSYSPVTLRDTFFRASHYFFMSEFYLQKLSDPRSDRAFKLWKEYFNKANALLAVPGQHLTLHTDHGFDVPAIIYRASEASASNPRPTLIVGGGFDSCMEETLHVFGFPALERGYNVILYEGPGQPTVLHQQRKGFIHDWEKVVTPLVDHIFAHKTDALSFIDTTKIGLIGYSLGGYLSARAAAFEPRLAALMCIDGVYDFGQALLDFMSDCRPAWDKGDEKTFNELYDTVSPSWSTVRRWASDQAKLGFQAKSGYEVLQGAAKMTLSGCAGNIKIPALIARAETDELISGWQPAKVAQEIGGKATLFILGAEQGAQEHCHVGATVFMNQTILEWFAEVVG